MSDQSKIEFKALPQGPVEAVGRNEPWNNTEADWLKILAQVPDFHGDQSRSVEILVQMSQGIKAIKDKLLSKGLISYKPPMLLVAYTGIAKNMSVLHTNDNGTDAVIMGANFLSNLSKLDFDRIGYLNRPDGVPFFSWQS